MPKKKSSFVAGIKQKLIDALLDTADNGRDAKEDPDGEKLREGLRGVLNEFDEQTESAEGIMAQLGTDVAAMQAFAGGGSRTLDELLVSTNSYPFDDISELSERFGALPKGYCYRYIVPETNAVSRDIADNANNVIRLPSALNLVVSEHFRSHGDEIPDRSLEEWLEWQPAELSRLWTLRVLSLFGILTRSELPRGERPAGSVAAAAPDAVPADDAEAGAEIAELVEGFREDALLHYDGEEDEGSDVSALNGVYDKRGTFAALKAIGPQAVAALRPLLDDPDIGVRVSAATYLLPSMPAMALPVLNEAASAWPGDESEKHSESATRHALQTLWMYEDGNLRPGEDAPQPKTFVKPEVKLLDDDTATLIDKFVKYAIISADALREDDNRKDASYIGRRHAIVATLDARSPDGRVALVPLLDHPDPAVRVAAGVRLLKLMPERALPVLEKVRDARDSAETAHPHWREASYKASMTISMYERNELDG